MQNSTVSHLWALPPCINFKSATCIPSKILKLKRNTNKSSTCNDKLILGRKSDNKKTVIYLFPDTKSIQKIIRTVYKKNYLGISIS